MYSSPKAKQLRDENQNEGKAAHTDKKAYSESSQQGCISERGNEKKGLKRKQIPNHLKRKEKHCFPKV